MNEKLLEEIRHELTSVSGLIAFDDMGVNVDHMKTIDENGNTHHVCTEVPVEDLIKLDFSKLIKKIDRELEV